MAVAAPLVSYVPLAVLGAVLAVVAWNMAEKDEFVALLKSSRGDAFVLLATFLLTVFVDLHDRASRSASWRARSCSCTAWRKAVEVEGGTLATEDQADNGEDGTARPAATATSSCFALRVRSSSARPRASATILDRIGERPRVFILDFSAVPLIDSTAAKALHGFVHKLQRSGTTDLFQRRARERGGGAGGSPGCGRRW